MWAASSVDKTAKRMVGQMDLKMVAMTVEKKDLKWALTRVEKRDLSMVVLKAVQ